MEVQTILLFIVLFILAVGVLMAVFKYGIAEKSYEEALAEQRQQSQVLLAPKTKSKDKKSKKVKKSETKAKETKAAKDNEEERHVEFKEAVEEVPVKPTKASPSAQKPMSKKEKIKPILINKEDKQEEEVPVEVSNNFDKTLPKDVVELVKVEQQDKKKEKKPIELPSVDKQVDKKETEVKQSEGSPVHVAKEGNIEQGDAVQPTAVNGVINNVGKEKKKKKSEYNTMQQLVSDANGPPVSLLLNLVRKAELSRSDVQILIDLLLNKQHEAPTTLSEWSEGKSDPVQKLKKQLAERERLLEEEQQSLQAAQSKMRELRAEHQEEKSKLQMKVKQIEDGFNGKQTEVARLVQQVQQLQAQFQEEVMKNHKLIDEIKAMQMQRQQYDIRLAQVQETDVIIGQLQNEVQELSNVNNQLRMELNRLSEENVNEKERQQSLIVQLNNFQKELEQKTERNRQLEEGRVDLERNMDKVLKQEFDLKAEIKRQTSVLRRQSEEFDKVCEELHQHKDESSRIIQQLSKDLEKSEEEKSNLQNTQLNGTLQESKQHELDILNLHNELDSLRNLLGQSRNECEVAVKSVQDLKHDLESEKAKVEEQKSKNNELRTKNWKVVEALNAAESRINNKSVKFSNTVPIEFIQRLFPEIKELSNIKEERFESESEPFIKSYLNDLKEQQVVPEEENQNEEVNQLKSQLQHYKKVIDETEKILNQLQKQIEQQEIDWHMKLTATQAELEAIKNHSNSQWQQKIARLEEQLREEQDAKKRVISELEKIQLETCNGIH